MNEIILIDKIEKRLREKREPIIFPLTPTHRKELRQLKQANVGNLFDRLRNIKQLKLEEYQKKHLNEIKNILKKKEKLCAFLNNDWKKRIISINLLLKQRKEIEDNEDLNSIQLEHSWDGIANLKEIKGEDRCFSFKEEELIRSIAKNEFEEKYKDSFEKVNEKINDIVTKYEEAINFGDLEIVKELYYIMKTADSLFVKINELKV